jgi:hypothetical protein
MDEIEMISDEVDNKKCLLTHVDQIQLLGAHIITLLRTLAKNPPKLNFFFNGYMNMMSFAT